MADFSTHPLPLLHFSQDVLEFNCFKVVETPDDGGPKRRGREKRRLFPPFPLPSPAVSSSFHPSFSYTCILTCVRSLILCVFVRRPRSEGSNWRKRRRFVEKQAIRDPTTRENNTQASPTATFQSGYSTSQFRLLRSLQEAAYRRG